MEPQKILVVDSYSALLNGIVSYLKGEFPQTAIFQAENVETGWSCVFREKPDITVASIQMRGKFNGLTLLRLICAYYPLLKVIIMADEFGHGFTFTCDDVCRMGASKTITKSMDLSKNICSAIRSL